MAEDSASLDVEVFRKEDLQIEEVLGKGGEAVVWKVNSDTYGPLALKVFKTGLPEEIVKEVNILMKRQQHPNIIQLFGLFRDSDFLTGNCFKGYVMEFSDRGSLDSGTCRNFQRLIHKLSMLVMRDGTVKLSDFGEAKNMDETNSYNLLLLQKGWATNPLARPQVLEVINCVKELDLTEPMQTCPLYGISDPPQSISFTIGQLDRPAETVVDIGTVSDNFKANLERASRAVKDKANLQEILNTVPKNVVMAIGLKEKLAETQELKPLQPLTRRSGTLCDLCRRRMPLANCKGMPQYPADDASISSDSSELFEKEVNTVNRCFDDIEPFVARVQSAGDAQKELKQRAHRYRTAQRSKDKGRLNHPDPSGILAMRAQLPLENEYVDVLRKFKLSFNLLAKLKGHIHEPNAPELLHFLFRPLQLIVESCHWGLGRNIAPQVVAPLLSLEARELLQNCLSSKESDIWKSLGEAWRTPPEDWPDALPPPYRPVFSDGFAPYSYPDQMNHGRQGTEGHEARSSNGD